MTQTTNEATHAVLESFHAWAARNLDRSLDDYTPAGRRAYTLAYENVRGVIEEFMEAHTGETTGPTWNELRGLYYRLFKTAWDIRESDDYTFAFEMRALLGFVKRSLFEAAAELDRLMEEAGH